MFARLTESQYRIVLSLLRSAVLKSSQRIVDQGYGNTNLYILRKGRALERSADSHRKVSLQNRILAIGTLFNEMAFVTGGRSDSTIEADTECTVWYIAREDFQSALAANADLAANITYAPETVSVIQRTSKYEWLEPGERVEIERQRHWWVFARQLWLPLLLAVAIGMFFLILPEVAPPGLLWFWPVISLPYVVWHFIDWKNDYFVVTDRHVVHRERVLFSLDQKNQLALEKVDSIKVERNGPMEFLLNLGKITLQGPNESQVVFDRVLDPEKLKTAITDEQARVKAATYYGSDHSRIRSDVRVAMEIAPRPIVATKQPEPTKSTFQRTREYFGSNLANFRRTVAPVSRVELNNGKQIVFRRHWLNLLRTILVPSMVLTVIGVTGGFMIAWQFNELTGFGWPVLCTPVLILWFIACGWWFYRYEDWRNDQFILDEDKVIDVDRKPFGGQTRRNEVLYDRITTVLTEVNGGIIKVLFNVGNVVIQKTGGDKLIIEWVHDPRSVQQDIFRRIEAAADKKRDRDKEQRRKELADWIGIYDEQARLHSNRAIK